MLPRRTTITIGAFVLMAAILPRGVRPTQLISMLTLFHFPAPPAEVSKPRPQIVAPKVPDLDIPAGSLDSFYASLRRGRVTRVLHYGDSPTTADSITADIRRLLQRRFGDAGHGFLLIAKPWAWYGHDGIRLDAKGWQIAPASQSRAADGIHGLGGVSFTGGAGAVSRVGLPGADYSRLTVYYLSQHDGGTFAITAGDMKIGEVQTAADETKPRFAQIALPTGAAAIELTVSSGRVRLFGYRFDKDQPGVQYSSLGVNGAQIQMVLRYYEPKQWTAALQHEDPALVVLNYGTNESVYPAYVEKQYPDELRKVIARIRTALPKASILLMGPMDHGETTPPVLEKLVEIQKQIAEETGCAFFNTFHAMGGAGTMNRWYHSEPRLVSADFMHPLPAGAARVGELFESALMEAYQ